MNNNRNLTNLQKSNVILTLITIVALSYYFVNVIAIWLIICIYVSYLFVDASLIIQSIKFIKDIWLYLAISGTKDNEVIPGWVFISNK